MDVAKQIKRFRKVKGLSQPVVAEKFSMNRVQSNRLKEMLSNAMIINN
jgi:transcriptional regulator with XRE-family HTH domain